MKVREEKLRTIIEWSEKNEDVRVLLLTSSLVNPLALVDEFSDLDIEFVFEDNTNYISDKSWTLKFGNPIAMIEEDESCFLVVVTNARLHRRVFAAEPCGTMA